MLKIGGSIGSGGLFGEGYGLSTQKLQYLPIQSTDFIYAVFAEEFGFIGSFMFLLFLLLYFFSIYKNRVELYNFHKIFAQTIYKPVAYLYVYIYLI